MENRYKTKDLEILIHNPDIDKNHDIIKEWINLKKTKMTENLHIRRANEIKRRSFFGMIIEFEKDHHPIGMIGFYKPQDENNSNKLIPFDIRYGVLSKSTVLDVLDEYFEHVGAWHLFFR